MEENKQKNIESLATEIYKFQTALTQQLMKDLPAIRENK